MFSGGNSFIKIEKWVVALGYTTMSSIFETHASEKWVAWHDQRASVSVEKVSMLQRIETGHKWSYEEAPGICLII